MQMMQTVRFHNPIGTNRFACEAAGAPGVHAGQMPAAESSADRAEAVSSQGIRTYQVGSLRIFTGYNISLSDTQYTSNSSSQVRDDWLLIYQQVGDEASNGGSSGVRLQSYACQLAGLRLAGQSMIIHFPRSAFRGLEDRLDAICGARSEFKANPILLAYLGLLRRNLPQLREGEEKLIEATTNQIIRSSIVRAVDSPCDTSSAARRSRLEAAKRFIDDRLTSDGLTVESVQASLGVSRRQLYSLFESYGGVARYILRQRLRRLHAFVSQSPEVASPGLVAEQFGIDSARLQRLFREEFGYGLEEARGREPAGSAKGTDSRLRKSQIA